MVLPRKILNVFFSFFSDDMELPYLYLTATFCAESSEKKIGLKHHISWTEKCCESEDRSEWFAGFWRRNFKVKSGQDSYHELIIWKVKPFVAAVTCGQYQIAFKWSVNFWLQLLKYTRDEMENISVDEFLFRHSSNSKTELAEIWQQTRVCIYASKNADWNQQ